MTKNMLKYGVTFSALVASGLASAVPIDTAAVTAQLGEGSLAVAAIGAAILTVWAIRKVYSMIGGR